MPAAEVDVSADLLRRLLTAQHPVAAAVRAVAVAVIVWSRRRASRSR
ncbi:hypothetical protein ABGB18_47605 [Nonomuraea sp. B12E4]